MMYTVIKHENLIDTDTVEVVCVTDSKDKAYKQMLIHAEDLYRDWEVVEDSLYSKRFTDSNREILIELSIHETLFIDW